MKRIIQEDSTGCGLACIAMLANKTYKTVRKVAERLEIKNQDKFYTGTKDLRELSQYFGIDIGFKRVKFNSYKSLPNIAILAINYREKSENWHWVVYYRTDNDEYVLDPKKTIKTDRRKDFSRITPKWYIKVNKI